MSSGSRGTVAVPAAMASREGASRARRAKAVHSAPARSPTQPAADAAQRCSPTVTSTSESMCHARGVG